MDYNVRAACNLPIYAADPSGKGLSLPICVRMLWLPTKAFKSRFEKVLLKEGHLSDTACAWRQHNQLFQTQKGDPKGEDCDFGH